MDAQEVKSKNKQKDAKILTTEMQNMSMKGKKQGKNRKFVVKTSLENPFILDWPIVSEIHQQEIIQLIKDSFANMKKDKSSKPPWSEVRKFKGKERRQFLEDHKQNHQENLSKDPTAVEQRKQLIEDWAHVVVGYNAVMRGVEQKKLAGVLVKKDAQPPFLTKTFLPGCANNGIPLLPVADLDTLLRDESTMGLPHSCLVVGLRSTAVEDGCRFFNLYSKMCESLNMETEDIEHSDNESIISESDNISDEEDNKENQVQRKNVSKMSEIEMSKYYLKRTNKKKRIFIPGEDTTTDKKDDDGLGFGSNFISLGGTEIDIPDEPKSSLTLIERGSNRVKNEQKSEVLSDITVDKEKEETSDRINCESNVDVSIMDSDNMFVVDSGGDDFVVDTGADDCDKNAPDSIKVENTEDNQGEEYKQIEDTKKCNQKKRKKSREKISPGQPAYIPAKVKRIKGNPNKKVETNEK